MVMVYGQQKLIVGIPPGDSITAEVSPLSESSVWLASPQLIDTLDANVYIERNYGGRVRVEIVDGVLRHAEYSGGILQR